MERLSSAAIIPDSFIGARDDIFMQFWLVWNMIKEPLIIPLLRMAVAMCLVMSVMIFAERLYMGVVIILVHVFGRNPEKRYKWEAIKDDVELGSSNYPMVLVQIPMFNEREVLFSSHVAFLVGD